jgi:hypothetical protein
MHAPHAVAEMAGALDVMARDLLRQTQLGLWWVAGLADAAAALPNTQMAELGALCEV